MSSEVSFTRLGSHSQISINVDESYPILQNQEARRTSEKTKTLCCRLFGAFCLACLAIAGGATFYAGRQLNTNDDESAGLPLIFLGLGAATLGSGGTLGCTVFSIYKYCKS